ncbi:MAG: amidohydrolase family protein [Nitrospirales bacterium]
MARVVKGVVDGDGHIRERDIEIWEHLDEPYRSSPPTLNFPFFPTLDGFQRGAGAARGAKKNEGPVDQKAWSALLDAASLDYAVLYPTAGLGIGMVQDPQWAEAVCRGYNNWLSERYFRVDQRLRGVALLPLQNIDAAVRELRRSVTELGMIGGMLPANSADMGVRKLLGNEMFWPLYEEAQRLDVPLSVHGAPSIGLGINAVEQVGAANILEHPLALMVQLTSMLLSGMYDAFPNLRVAYLEADTGWFPYMLDRVAPRMRGLKNSDPIELARSGRLLVSVEGVDRNLPYCIQRVGDECIIYASDYPHEAREEVVEELDEALARTDVSETNLQNVYRENALRFYNWDAGIAVGERHEAASAR